LGASRKEREVMDDNIEEITASKELLDYIRGEKRYKNIRPKVDYARWRYIANYLASNENFSVKKKIVNILLDLLESKNWQDLYAVEGICQNIESPDVDKKLEQMILKADFFSLPDSIIGFTSKYVMKKRLDSVAQQVVQNAIRKNHIDWVVTMVSANWNEQEVYWNYCDRMINNVLIEVSENEKAKVLEETIYWKDNIMKIIDKLNNKERL
jgi:hypothetical protein